LSLFINIFVTVLLPLSIVVGAAYLLGRFRRLNPAPLASTAFYLLGPALVFVSMSTTSVSIDILGRLFLLKVATNLLIIVIMSLLGAQMRLAPTIASALLLSTAFSNSGNLGLSVTEFAFGKDAVAFALICFVADNIMMNSVGVYLAARGRTPAREAASQVLRNPAIYALPLGLAVSQFHWVLPVPLMRGLEMLSRAAVPTMLIVLGMQLAVLPFDRSYWKLIGLASAVRLIVAPVLAALLTIPLGLTGVPRQVSILEAAVPAAVTANIIASRYDTEPNLVAGSVLVSSLLSLIIITILLSLMQ
jgi:malate permease and related proteins